MKEPKRGQAEMEDRNRPDSSIMHSSLQNTSVDSSPSFMGDNFFHDNFLYFYIRKSFVSITLGYTGISFVFGGLGVWAPQYIELISKHFNAQSKEMSNERFIGYRIYFETQAVIIGGEITAYFRNRNRPIEIYMCIACCLASAISLYFFIYLSLISLSLTWLVVGPLHRSRGSAIQIFSIHALGDAISPFIIGYII
ncbi:hypothetical protein MXB_5145 [Myxobolus squamalis]|nr:hypothetical protein MXB_5145 [Myxobolus squamalis]